MRKSQGHIKPENTVTTEVRFDDPLIRFNKTDLEHKTRRQIYNLNRPFYFRKIMPPQSEYVLK
jgi:hypothetical protein